MAKIDLVMVTWDRLAYTKQALESLFNQEGQEWHLTIVDNGSKDGTQEYLKTFDDSKIDVVLWDRNKGLSEATDYVFSNSKAEYIGRLDNDTYAPKDWLSRMVKAHEAYDKFGFIGGMHFTQNQLAPYEPNITEYNGIKIWEKNHIGGCSFVIKRKDYKDKIGGQGVMGLTEYQWKFRDAGLINGYLYPFIYVDHMEYNESPRNIKTDEYEGYSLRVRGMGTDDYSNEQNRSAHNILYFKENTK